MQKLIYDFNIEDSSGNLIIDSRNKNKKEEKDLAFASLKKLNGLVTKLFSENKLNVLQKKTVIEIAYKIKKRYVDKSNNSWNNTITAIANFFGFETSVQKKIKIFDQIIKITDATFIEQIKKKPNEDFTNKNITPLNDQLEEKKNQIISRAIPNQKINQANSFDWTSIDFSKDFLELFPEVIKLASDKIENIEETSANPATSLEVICELQADNPANTKNNSNESPADKPANTVDDIHETPTKKLSTPSSDINESRVNKLADPLDDKIATPGDDINEFSINNKNPAAATLGHNKNLLDPAHTQDVLTPPEENSSTQIISKQDLPSSLAIWWSPEEMAALASSSATELKIASETKAAQTYQSFTGSDYNKENVSHLQMRFFKLIKSIYIFPFLPLEEQAKDLRYFHNVFRNIIENKPNKQKFILEQLNKILSEEINLKDLFLKDIKTIDEKQTPQDSSLNQEVELSWKPFDIANYSKMSTDDISKIIHNKTVHAYKHFFNNEFDPQQASFFQTYFYRTIQLVYIAALLPKENRENFLEEINFNLAYIIENQPLKRNIVLDKLNTIASFDNNLKSFLNAILNSTQTDLKSQEQTLEEKFCNLKWKPSEIELFSQSSSEEISKYLNNKTMDSYKYFVGAEYDLLKASSLQQNFYNLIQIIYKTDLLEPQYRDNALNQFNSVFKEIFDTTPYKVKFILENLIKITNHEQLKVFFNNYVNKIAETNIPQDQNLGEEFVDLAWTSQELSDLKLHVLNAPQLELIINQKALHAYKNLMGHDYDPQEASCLQNKFFELIQFTYKQHFISSPQDELKYFYNSWNWIVTNTPHKQKFILERLIGIAHTHIIRDFYKNILAAIDETLIVQDQNLEEKFINLAWTAKEIDKLSIAPKEELNKSIEQKASHAFKIFTGNNYLKDLASHLENKFFQLLTLSYKQPFVTVEENLLDIEATTEIFENIAKQYPHKQKFILESLKALVPRDEIQIAIYNFDLSKITASNIAQDPNLNEAYAELFTALKVSALMIRWTASLPVKIYNAFFS